MLSFKHQNPVNVRNGDTPYPKGTLAFKLPTPEEIKQLLATHSGGIPIQIGLAQCSESDQFNKKIGIKLSQQEMKAYICFFKNMEVRYDSYVFHFETTIHNKCKFNQNRPFKVEFGFSTTYKSDKVDLLYAYLV